LLQLGHLVEVKGQRAVITQGGFDFLLKEVNAQVWSLLIVYLEESSPTLSMETVDVLSFIFMLGSLELGQAYSTANLTPTQSRMLEDLNDFGLIYRMGSSTTASTSGGEYFYPTRPATTLTSDAPALTNTISNSLSSPSSPQAQQQKGYIIIETNYRLYAYTTSLLQIAVLNLFTRLHTRFPNLVSGKLTKESVQRAVDLGIKSDQIISYLKTHAHPQMRAAAGSGEARLPPTVMDQIRLWQMEQDRMVDSPGFLMKDFSGEEEYRRNRDYARDLAVLIWWSDARRCFFVSRIEQLAAFAKNQAKR